LEVEVPEQREVLAQHQEEMAKILRGVQLALQILPLKVAEAEDTLLQVE
jgi:hypothetical protein